MSLVDLVIQLSKYLGNCVLYTKNVGSINYNKSRGCHQIVWQNRKDYKAIRLNMLSRVITMVAERDSFEKCSFF